MVAVRERI
jgi:hypothetical protein